MNDLRGVTRQGGAIADSVENEEEPVRPVHPTTEAVIDNQLEPKLILLGVALIIGYIYLMKLLKLMYEGEKEGFLKYFLMCTYSMPLIKVGSYIARFCYDFGRSLYKKSSPHHD